MRLRLPQLGRPVCEVQPGKKTEPAGGLQRLCEGHQTPDAGDVSRRLPAEELAVRRLVGGTANSSDARSLARTHAAHGSALTSCPPPLAQCSKTCGRGSRGREPFCMNNLGRRLADRECSEHPRVVSQSCNDQPCPKWSLGEWSEVGTRVAAPRCEAGGAA